MAELVGPVSHPCVVSTAIDDLVAAEPHDGRILAIFPSAVYIDLGGIVVAIVTEDGVRLANAAVIPLPRRAAPFASLRAGGQARIGGGEIATENVVARRVRTWAARPRLGEIDRSRLRAGLDRLADILSAASRRPSLPFPASFAETCRRRDLPAAKREADMLLGLGPGLTPSGDDIVAGALCALRLLGGEKTFTAALADHVTGAALTRTTALSATLLRLAAQGDVAAEVGRVFMGITGHACLDEPARRLLEIGHTSGADLAAGLLAGGAAALEHAR